MNIHKSRFAAIIGLFLLLCMMTAMIAVPASAAEYEVTAYMKVYNGNNTTIGFLELLKADLHGFENYTELAQAMGTIQFYPVCYDFVNNRAFVQPAYTDHMLKRYEAVTGYSLVNKVDPTTYYSKSSKGSVPIYRIIDPLMPPEFTSSPQTFYYNDDDIVDAVTTDTLSVVLNEILCLLPIVIPVLIGFIGLDKAIKFITGVLHSA